MRKPLQEYLLDTGRSLGFLSRLSIPGFFFRDFAGTYTKTARAFPLAGLVIGLLPASSIAISAALGLSSLIVAIVAIGLQIMLTGALHEDGLADSADGMGGGRSRERALEIMRDSRVGSYGAIALIVTIILRTALVSALIDTKGWATTALSVLAVAAQSRAVMVLHWHVLTPARKEGVAASSGQPDRTAALTALAVSLVIHLALTLHGFGIWGTLLPAFLSALAAMWFGRIVDRKLGGHTGDTIGATQQISEIALYLGLVLVTKVTPSTTGIG